ncbi:hypothetical protein P154DRAFT_617419 [Amniculicola lignicola CBS 123094]|uniref:Uncharacterized protein n=1 Tax=Amniculicola lignicola CBS 123094 TaxID=1392246 RepID=A0A6A5WPI8_9PLEO|nr:hypothetical protein P154DRAFT_617419 [Amniculicola lignicola CBS 123094]
MSTNMQRASRAPNSQEFTQDPPEIFPFLVDEHQISGASVDWLVRDVSNWESTDSSRDQFVIPDAAPSHPPGSTIEHNAGRNVFLLISSDNLVNYGAFSQTFEGFPFPADELQNHPFPPHNSQDFSFLADGSQNLLLPPGNPQDFSFLADDSQSLLLPPANSQGFPFLAEELQLSGASLDGRICNVSEISEPQSPNLPCGYFPPPDAKTSSSLICDICPNMNDIDLPLKPPEKNGFETSGLHQLLTDKENPIHTELLLSNQRQPQIPLLPLMHRNVAPKALHRKGASTQFGVFGTKTIKRKPFDAEKKPRTKERRKIGACLPCHFSGKRVIGFLCDGPNIPSCNRCSKLYSSYSWQPCISIQNCLPTLVVDFDIRNLPKTYNLDQIDLSSFFEQNNLPK